MFTWNLVIAGKSYYHVHWVCFFQGTGQTGALKPAINAGNQNTWVQRPRTDNGEPCKTVLGPVSSQDRRTGSVLCEMVRKNTEKEILDLVEYMPMYRRYLFSSRKHAFIIPPPPPPPLNPTFSIVKLGFTGVSIIFSYFCSKT